jgi:uracil-DNA glycosylase
MPDAVRDIQKIPRLLDRLDEVLKEEARLGVQPAASPQPDPEPEQLGLF